MADTLRAFEIRRALNGTTSEIGKQSGQPCVAGTRMPLASLIAECADDPLLESVCERFDLDVTACRLAMHGAAKAINLLAVKKRRTPQGVWRKIVRVTENGQWTTREAVLSCGHKVRTQGAFKARCQKCKS